jgi:mono/diheme cytochrome c family protein
LGSVAKLITFVALIVVGGGGYLFIVLPDVDGPFDVSIDATPERIERGHYLVNHVTGCLVCHSTRDWSLYAGPIIAGSEGMGGERWSVEMKIPGTIYSSNITPAAISSWTEGEVIRAMTGGVSRDGRALFPVMPYAEYGIMSSEDVHAVVAYVRSLNAVENDVPERALDFPMSLIVRTIPSNPQPASIDSSDSIKYGEYLATIAGCLTCHTQAEMGEPLPGMKGAGGFEFRMPWGTVRSSNITPDKKTGIGKWTKASFVAVFKAFDGAGPVPLDEADLPFNTVMPWMSFAGMSTTDLSAIFDYLQTLDPVANSVNRY